jgi:hypothetical protein
VLKGNFSKIGKICDICSDGLSFRYLANDMAAEAFSYVDIFSVKNGFYLYDMPCKIIYEAEDESFGKGFITQRFRCGLQFCEPTKSQSEQLELFMRHYVSGMAG